MSAIVLRNPGEAPLRSVALGGRASVTETRADGTVLLRNPQALGEYPRRYTDKLVFWADRAPERVFLAQRGQDGAWDATSYGEAHATVRRLARGLLECGLSAERPLAILSGNTVEHALLGLAAMHVGVPYAPISTAFSLLSRDHAKLQHVLGILRPGMVFVESTAAFSDALRAALPAEARLACVRNDGALSGAISYAQLCAHDADGSVELAARAVGPDSVAKILFTSGSSAMPKGVINTHRMLCANQHMGTQCWPFLQTSPPVIVDWLPWNHTFGGNFVFGLGLYHGGSLYIDDGRPMGAEFERTLRNLREIQPTVFFGIPKVFEMLALAMEGDGALRGAFFSRLQMMFYAAASMPEGVWDSLRSQAIRTTGERIFTCTALGSTETAPLAITVTWDVDRPNVMGLPTPGVELKLVPNDRKLELRLRGPNITPGYLDDPARTREAFDEEGFYRIGDAMRFADPEDPDQGLVFDGRIAEDYKLSTGTWVNAGPLRAMVNGILSPLVRDVLPVGHSRDEVGILAFPEFEACRRLAGLGPEARCLDIAEHPRVREEFQRRLDEIAAQGTSTVNTVTRMMLMHEPLLDVECTDKGTLSFNVVLERRAADIEELYADPPSPRAIWRTSRPVQRARPRGR